MGAMPSGYIAAAISTYSSSDYRYKSMVSCQGVNAKFDARRLFVYTQMPGLSPHANQIA